MKQIFLFALCLTIFIGSPKALAAPECSSVFAAYKADQSGVHQGSQWQNWQSVEAYAQKMNEPGFVVVYRGQRVLTPRVLSRTAQERGQQASEALLSDLIQQAKSWRDWTIDQAKTTSDAGMIDQVARFAKLSDVQIATRKHAASDFGQSPFISTSRSAEVAGGKFNGGTYIRYIYVLKVPESEAIDVRQMHQIMSNPELYINEAEVAVTHEATAYVQAVVDLKTGTFYSAEAWRTLPESIFRKSSEDENERIEQILNLIRH